MPTMVDGANSTSVSLSCMSVENLLLLVGDEESGCKSSAIDALLSMELESIFPIFEQAIRNDGHADLRNSAMEVLIRFGGQAVPKLLVLLRDDNEEVRNFCTVMLGEIGSREAVTPLIHALRDTDVNVRHGTAEALGKIGDRTALLPLLDLLEEDFWLQFPAIAAIAAMKDNRAVPHLLKLLGHPMLEGVVIDALGEIGDPRALSYLGDILENSDETITGKTIQAIVKIYRNMEDDCRYKNSLATSRQISLKNSIIKSSCVVKIKTVLAPGGDPDTLKAAIALLGWLGETSMLPQLFLLLENDDFLDVAESSILAMGKEAVPLLNEALHHPSDNVRIVAVRSLRWLGEQYDQAFYKPLLFDNCLKVQTEVLESLKETTFSEIIPRLFEFLENGDEHIRTLSAQILGCYPYSELHGYLKGMIASSDAFRRKCAATLIGSMSQSVPPTTLGCLIKDADSEVRKEAVSAAGRLKFIKIIPYLIDALSDPDTGVQEKAVLSLAEFGSDAPLMKILPLLRSGRETLDYTIIKAVGKIGSVEAGVSLIGFQREGNISRSIEFALIETLGRIGHKAAAVMITTLYLNHGDSDFRRCAAQALGEIAAQDSLNAIRDACNDAHWSVRIASMEALVKICGHTSLPVILEALNDPDPMVRKHAIQLLGNLRDIHAITKLVGLLTDPEMGKYAFEALLEVGRTVLPWLHRVMKGDYQLDVREMVIDLVGKIGDRKSIEPLIQVLDDPLPAIRLAALDSLVFCFDSLPLKKLSQVMQSDVDAEVRKKAFQAMQTLTSEKFFT